MTSHSWKIGYYLGREVPLRRPRPQHSVSKTVLSNPPWQRAAAPRSLPVDERREQARAPRHSRFHVTLSCEILLRGKVRFPGSSLSCCCCCYCWSLLNCYPTAERWTEWHHWAPSLVGRWQCYRPTSSLERWPRHHPSGCMALTLASGNRREVRCLSCPSLPSENPARL